MKSFKIEGGVPLSGEITVSGNKNAVLPMIAASLLTDEEVVLHNVPKIVDVQVMLEIMEHLGAAINFSGNTLKIRTKDIRSNEISREFCSRIRTSILFAGPLSIRAGEAGLWPPGGDVIGRRRLDGHFYGLRSLGVNINTEDIPFRFTVEGRLTGRELFLDEASVTATEQLLMAAVTARGQTVILNAASEPHVTDLAELLIKMGAVISGLNSNTLIIDGVEKLSGAEHTVVEDHIETGSFLMLAAATGGELTVHGIVPRHYWMIRRVLERLGFELKISADKIIIAGGGKPGIRPDFGNHVPVIADGPWPQFPSDMMSCAIVTATQSAGTVLFFEKMFESRIYFVDRLISMGANAIVCDPHRVVINGPSRLTGQTLASPDIRAGMALLIAALCAQGTSTINEAGIIARGYEDIARKILSLGGKIEVVK